MSEWYAPNREIIKNLSINTGSSSSAEWTPICTLSEASINYDFNKSDFYTFCDAIQRSVITGVAMTIEATVKIDVNNKAIMQLIGDVASLIENGTISQFNNKTFRFELLTSVSSSVLTYTKYEVPCVMQLEKLGGPAEDEGEFALTLTINGKGTVISE